MVAQALAYDERLTAPRSWWLIAGLVGVGGGLVMLPLGVLPMLLGVAAAGVLAALGVSSYGSARIRVVSGSLVAGDARLPLSALGTAHVLDEEEAFAWRTRKADPRAHMLLRSYIRTAVRVEVADPDDPTPYLYLSTRTPQRLAAALGGPAEQRETRASAQGEAEEHGEAGRKERPLEEKEEGRAAQPE